jgi:hypothetical protein
MSANLYDVCIFWTDQRGGRAKFDGVEVHLHRVPRIGKLRPRIIEFAPEVHLYRIAENDWDAPRDMTPAEIADANLFLSRMSSAVRDEVG